MFLLLDNANRKFVLTSERGGPKNRQQYRTVPKRVPSAFIFNMSALALCEVFEICRQIIHQKNKTKNKITFTINSNYLIDKTNSLANSRELAWHC